MTQAEKSAAWDALIGLMEDDTSSLVLANTAHMRRMFWSQGEWHTNASQGRGGSFTIELYRGNDPLAAIATLMAE